MISTKDVRRLRLANQHLSCNTHISVPIDENFAREIMQLFSMGLFQLNMDGSPKLDKDGTSLMTYTNDDILSLSRAWTGFDLQSPQGNLEGSDNQVYPMKIVAEWRDQFPKFNTMGDYIGDSYLLCSDFPSKSFLRKRASYCFLGSSSLPELMNDPTDFATEDTVVRVVLNETSALRAVLCNKDGSGSCVYQNSVTLPAHIACTGIECNIDTVRVVQVSATAYYKFVPLPCVDMVFYNNPTKISPRHIADPSMCANPILPVASEACCSIGNVYATRNSNYSGERMTLETAEDRCSEASKEICYGFDKVNGELYLNRGFFWTGTSCLLRVKIRRDGMIAIVHQPSDLSGQVLHMNGGNDNYFKAYWGRIGDYPSVDNDCENVCEVLSEGSCLCNTRVIESTVFNGRPRSQVEVLNKLSVGAIHPDTFDTGTYSSINDRNTNITIHLKGTRYDSNTVFEFVDGKGRKFLMRTMKSFVYLQGITSGYTGQSFRNAPQFMSFIPSETTPR